VMKDALEFLAIKVACYCVLEAILDSTSDIATLENAAGNLTPESMVIEIRMHLIPRETYDFCIRYARVCRHLGVLDSSKTTRGAFFKWHVNYSHSLSEEKRAAYERANEERYAKHCENYNFSQQRIADAAYRLILRLSDLPTHDHKGPTDSEQQLTHRERLRVAYTHALMKAESDLPKGKFAAFKKQTERVEIIKDEQVYRVYFPVPDICESLLDLPYFQEHADELMQDIPRDNPTRKAVDLASRFQQLSDEMLHYKGLLESTTWVETMIKNFTTIDAIQFRLAMLQIFIAILFYGEKSEPFVHYYYVPQFMIYLLAVALLVATTVRIAFYVIVEAPVESWTAEVVEHRYQELEDDPNCAVAEKDALPYLPPPPIRIVEEEILITTLKNCMYAPIFWYMIVYWCFAFAISLNPFTETDLTFVSALLTIDYFRMPAGEEILQSVHVGASGLFNAFIAGLTMIIIWCCLSFLFFDFNIGNNNDCTTAYRCIFKGLNEGLHGDLATFHGDNFGNLPATYPMWISSIPDQQAQWFLVITFFLIWEYILAGIVQGQIVDAFAGIRAHKDMQDEDVNAYCLVCSLGRPALDEVGGFADHVENDHSPWSYLKFCTFVKETPDLCVQDCLEFHQTGMLSHVQDLMDACDHHYLPNMTCLASSLVREDNSQADNVQTINDGVSSALKQIDELRRDQHALSQKLESGLQDVMAAVMQNAAVPDETLLIHPPADTNEGHADEG